MPKKDLRKHLSFDNLTKMAQDHHQRKPSMQSMQGHAAHVGHKSGHAGHKSGPHKVILIHEDLHAALKALSAQRKKTLRTLVHECLQDFIATAQP